MDKNVIWISWQKHRRTEEIAHQINCKLFIIDYKCNRLLRYILSIFYTLYILSIYRPNVLLVQNPSIILSSLTCFCKKIFKYKLIVDAHNVAIIPDNFIKHFNQINKYIQKKADITIVTNHHLLSIVNKNGGNAFILKDKIPTISCSEINKTNLSCCWNIACICTFGNDEPYLNVFEAAYYLPENICIYITGNHNKLSQIPLYNNLYFTGFISEEQYWNLLCSVDAIMDLTTRNHCLVCGAYEGLACEKPLILSDTTINKEYFYKGVIYTKNDSYSIANSINELFKNINTLSHDIHDLRTHLDVLWHEQILDFKRTIEILCSNVR